GHAYLYGVHWTRRPPAEDRERPRCIPFRPHRGGEERPGGGVAPARPTGAGLDGLFQGARRTGLGVAVLRRFQPAGPLQRVVRRHDGAGPDDHATPGPAWLGRHRALLRTLVP